MQVILPLFFCVETSFTTCTAAVLQQCLNINLTAMCCEQAISKSFLGTGEVLPKIMQNRLGVIGLLLCSWK